MVHGPILSTVAYEFPVSVNENPDKQNTKKPNYSRLSFLCTIIIGRLWFL